MNKNFSIYFIILSLFQFNSLQIKQEFQNKCDGFADQSSLAARKVTTTLDRTKLLRYLRELLKEEGYDAYFFISSDAHQDEYISDCDKYTEFLTSFTAENCQIVVTQTEALVWTDSRFYLQATLELLPDWQLKKIELNEPTWFEYLVQKYGGNIKVAFEPTQQPIESVKATKTYFKNFDIEYIPATKNLLKQLWIDRPVVPATQVFIHKLKYCGRTTQDKINDIYQQIKDQDITYILEADLSEIAWILNLRANDIQDNPFFYSYLVIKFIYNEKKEFQGYSGVVFVKKEQIDETVEDYLKSINIERQDYNDVFTYLPTLNETILVDKSKCNFKLYNSIKNESLISNINSPIQLLKTIKNSVELQNSVNTHLRDAAAITCYLSWLEQKLNVEKVETITEYEGAKQLKAFRQKQKNYVENSFITISAIGKNGAIIHYTPTEESSSLINNKEMYLLDSGAQYLDGTTDVTRTMHYGTPTDREKLMYTTVLQGALELIRLKFPSDKNYSPADIDPIVRKHLWKMGLDFAHGTGHGVGFFSAVHEYPFIIKRTYHVPFVENIIITVEPGYYEANNFGLRIENDLILKKSKEFPNFFEFEFLTYVPFAKNLIQKDLLTQDEIDFINDYHNKVYEKIQPILKDQKETIAEQWLKEQTTAL